MKNRNFAAIMAMILMLVVQLVLAGCGKSGEDNPAKDDKTPAAKEQRDRKKGD